MALRCTSYAFYVTRTRVEWVVKLSTALDKLPNVACSAVRVDFAT